jgi:hypothetical protein
VQVFKYLNYVPSVAGFFFSWLIWALVQGLCPMLTATAAPAISQPDHNTTATSFLEPGEVVDEVIHGRVHVATASFGRYPYPVMSSLYFFGADGKMIAKHKILPADTTYAKTKVIFSGKYVAAYRFYTTQERAKKNLGLTGDVMIFDLSGKRMCGFSSALTNTELALDDDNGRIMMLDAKKGVYEVRSINGKLFKRTRFSNWVGPTDGESAMVPPVMDWYVERSEDGKFLAIVRNELRPKVWFYELTLIRMDGSVLFQKRVEGITCAPTDVWNSLGQVVVYEDKRGGASESPTPCVVYSFTGKRVGEITVEERNNRRMEIERGGQTK